MRGKTRFSQLSSLIRFLRFSHPSSLIAHQGYTDMFKKTIKYLSSIRFTIVLIILLGIIFLLGLWIPLKSLVQNLYFQWQENSPRLVAVLDALQLTSIPSSPLTLLLWFFFFVTLGLGLFLRIP